MQLFVDAVAAELERPRPLLKQVVDHLASHYSVSRNELGVFFTDQLGALEDYEVDLLFSPLFTPTLAEQAVFSDLLDRQTLPGCEWPGLVRRPLPGPRLHRPCLSPAHPHRADHRPELHEHGELFHAGVGGAAGLGRAGRAHHLAHPRGTRLRDRGLPGIAPEARYSDRGR